MVEIRKYDIEVDGWSVFERFAREMWGEPSALGDEAHYRWMFERGFSYVVWDGDRIVGHSGVVTSPIVLDGVERRGAWNVSSFILPEYRGQGIGSEVYRRVLTEFDLVGGFGYNERVAHLHERIGANNLHDVKARKIIKVLDERVYKTHCTGEIRLEDIQQRNGVELLAYNPIRLDWLSHRVFQHPYNCYHNIKNSIIRQEYYMLNKHRTLEKPVFRVLYRPFVSDDETTENLVRLANECDACAIEFQCVGYPDMSDYIKHGFREVHEDDWQHFPMYSSPIAHKPNMERIRFNSDKADIQVLIERVNGENIYFTRIDSDRDRWNPC